MKIRIAALDQLFSKYIRTRDKWACQRCGKPYKPPTNALHCAHAFSRRHKLTRFDEDNADALCYGCHQYFGENPLKHLAWKKERIGEERFRQLEMRHQMIGKVDEVAVAVKYRALLKEMAA